MSGAGEIQANHAGNAAFQRLTEVAARKSSPKGAGAGKRPKDTPADAAGGCIMDLITWKDVKRGIS